MTNWDDYRVFITVARAGNFYRAALELSTTQATVSRRIQSLERALGLTLFDRPKGRGGVTLTFDGRRVLQDVVAAELCLSRTHALQQTGVATEGDCKILGTDGIANFWMPTFLRAFTLKYPGIQLKYFFTTDPALNQRPPYDLQLQYLAGTEADTVSHQLATLHFMFYATHDYLSEFGRPNTLRDLAHHRVFKFSSFISDERSWAEYSIDLANQHGTIYANSGAFLVDLVLANAGISALPTYLSAISPRLVALLPEFHLKAGIFLNFHREIAKKPAVRATIDFLKEEAFDRRRMPWFRDRFEPPAPNWQALYRNLIAETVPALPARMAG